MFVVALVAAREGIVEAPKAADPPRLAAVATPLPPEPPQAPAKAPEAPATISFRCPQRAREMCEEYGLDTAVFNQAERMHMGAGESYLFRDLNSHDAVTLYEMFNAVIEQGGGKKVPGMYEIRRKLEVILDDHFDHAQRKGTIH